MRSGDTNRSGNEGSPVPGELKRRLEELAQQIVMFRGILVATTHEGALSKIEAQYRVNVIRNESTIDRNDRNDVIFSKCAVAEFARTNLEEAVVACVGRFGHIEADVNGGQVTELRTFGRYKFPQKQRSGEPPRPAPESNRATLTLKCQ